MLFNLEFALEWRVKFNLWFKLLNFRYIFQQNVSRIPLFSIYLYIFISNFIRMRFLTHIEQPCTCHHYSHRLAFISCVMPLSDIMAAINLKLFSIFEIEFSQCYVYGSVWYTLQYKQNLQSILNLKTIFMSWFNFLNKSPNIKRN